MKERYFFVSYQQLNIEKHLMGFGHVYYKINAPYFCANLVAESIRKDNGATNVGIIHYHEISREEFDFNMDVDLQRLIQ